MTPAEHYKEAERLLSSFAPDQVDQRFALARIRKAHVHAVLATCQPPLEFDAYNVFQADENGDMEVRRATGDRL